MPPRSASLRFFYSPTAVGPSFVTPVFESNGFYVLEGRLDGKIEGFQEWEWVDASSRRLLTLLKQIKPLPTTERTFFRDSLWTPILTATVDGSEVEPVFPFSFRVVPLGERDRETLCMSAVGEPMRIAYAVGHLVLFGSTFELQNELRKGRDSNVWESTPFCEIEVADFIQDRRQYAGAVNRAANIMRDNDEEIAAKWLRFMLENEMPEKRATTDNPNE